MKIGNTVLPAFPTVILSPEVASLGFAEQNITTVPVAWLAILSLSLKKKKKCTLGCSSPFQLSAEPSHSLLRLKYGSGRVGFKKI